MRAQRTCRGIALAAAGIVSLAGAAGPASAGAVTGTVVVRKEGGGALTDRSGAVVYLENVPGAPPVRGKSPAAVQVRQKEQQFAPSLAVTVKGATVEFPNDDKIFHNVFSLSEAARFDLGLYKSGTSKSVTFKRAGVVDVYCNIHPNMIAKVLVLDSAHYAVTGPDGGFRIADVPPGTYPIVAWQAYGPEYRGEVRVEASGAARVDIALTQGRRSKQHLRKDGTPYGRYR